MNSTEKQKLFVLIGIPGSGKTTLASEMIESIGDNVVHISRDNVRDEVGDKVYNRKSEQRVFKEYIRRIASSLKMGYDVIADSTNLTEEKRYIYFALKEALEKAQLADVDVIGIFVSTPLSVCLERNSERHGDAKVPDIVIESMHSKIEEPLYEEGFKIIMNKN